MKEAAFILNGKILASSVYADLSRAIGYLRDALSITPKLCVFLVGNNPASLVYVKNKILKAQEIGIEIDFIHLTENASQKDLVDMLHEKSNDDSTHGILLQLPLPKHIDQFEAINAISAHKDVDGFTVYNVGLLNSWCDCLEPSTPKGIMLLIKSALGKDLSGKKAVVIGRSIIVGRPISSMLLKENCSVVMLHSKSHDIPQEASTADILIAAIGSPNYINSSFIKPGACVIDVGITRVEDKLYGDVDFESASKIAGYITPVPGGVGPMTVACMLANTVKACFNQNKLDYTPYANV